MRVTHRNTESCRNHYPMHICSTCIFITSPVKRRSPLHSIWIFYPPLLTTAFSIFLFKGSSQNKRKAKVLQGGEKSGCSFPLLLQNKRASCNSQRKYVFSVGALFARLHRACPSNISEVWKWAQTPLKNTQTHTLHYPSFGALVYYLFTLHQNWAAE